MNGAPFLDELDLHCSRCGRLLTGPVSEELTRCALQLARELEPLGDDLEVTITGTCVECGATS